MAAGCFTLVVNRPLESLEWERPACCDCDEGSPPIGVDQIRENRVMLGAPPRQGWPGLGPSQSAEIDSRDVGTSPPCSFSAAGPEADTPLTPRHVACIPT